MGDRKANVCRQRCINYHFQTQCTLHPFVLLGRLPSESSSDKAKCETGHKLCEAACLDEYNRLLDTRTVHGALINWDECDSKCNNEKHECLESTSRR